jgi:hypothetical protein
MVKSTQRAPIAEAPFAKASTLNESIVAFHSVLPPSFVSWSQFCR